MEKKQAKMLNEKDRIPYLLRKNGMWYAHNDCGYTARAELAELYTKERAERSAAHCEEITAVPLTDIIKSAEHRLQSQGCGFVKFGR